MRTKEYKLTPIMEKCRELLGAAVTVDDAGRRRVGRVRGGRSLFNWVGISADEIARITPSRVSYMRRVDPLVELMPTPWTRMACLTYLEQRWPTTVPRSACIGCPYHRDDVWRTMRDQRPAEWADAVEFDRAIRNGAGGGRTTWRSTSYLHRSRVPLDEVDLGTAADDRVDARMSLFDDPHGCSPFGCDRGDPT